MRPESLAVSQAARDVAYAEHQTGIEQAAVRGAFAETAKRLDAMGTRISRVEQNASAETRDIAQDVAELRADLAECRADLARLQRMISAEMDLMEKSTSDGLHALSTRLIVADVAKAVTSKRRTRMIPRRDPETQRIVSVDTIEVEE